MIYDTWVLGPHGEQKHVARWVLEKYEGRKDYKDNQTVQLWVKASRQILESTTTKERSSLYVEPGE